MQEQTRDLSGSEESRVVNHSICCVDVAEVRFNLLCDFLNLLKPIFHIVNKWHHNWESCKFVLKNDVFFGGVEFKPNVGRQQHLYL